MSERRFRPAPARLYALIGIMVLFWAMNFIVSKVALRTFPPLLVSALRTSLAGAVIVPFFLLNGRRDKGPISADAPVLIFLNERFPTALRASGTGLSWNIGFALGGMMPTFVSLVSGSPAEIPMSLAYFAVGVFVIYLIGAIVIPETKGNFR